MNPLTSEVKLLYWLPDGGLFVLVVGDGGVLEHEPVLFVRPQGESLRPLSEKKKKIKIQDRVKAKRCMFVR